MQVPLVLTRKKRGAEYWGATVGSRRSAHLQERAEATMAHVTRVPNTAKEALSANLCKKN